MIISPYPNFVDHPVYNILKEIKTDIPIIMLTKFSDFVFDEKFYDLKEYILADYLEMGANDYDRKETLLWGKNSHLFKKAQTEEWQKFDKFVQEHPAKIIFKRELLSKDKGGNVHPIEFTCNYTIPPIVSKKEFYKRPLSVFFYWGWSNEGRRSLHGNFFINATTKGITVIDNFYHLEEGMKDYAEGKQIWVTVCVPHFARLPMENVLYINGQSKLSVSLAGAGAKCFRMGESSINSAMVMQDDKMAYSYEWIDGVNCFKIPLGDTLDEIRGVKNQWAAIETIEAALDNKNLYDVYCGSVENCKNYFLPTYVTNYLQPLINSI